MRLSGIYERKLNFFSKFENNITDPPLEGLELSFGESGLPGGRPQPLPSPPEETQESDDGDAHHAREGSSSHIYFLKIFF